MSITHLQTQHITEPLGFFMEQPTLSWQVEWPKGQILETTAIQIWTGQKNVVFESEKDGILPQTGYRAAFTPEPRTRYEWQVTATYADGTTEQSAVASFETAKQDEPWFGQWITSKVEGLTHPKFRKGITPTAAVTSARLYVTALGVYEAYLNGEKVGDEYLTPAYNDYNNWIQYQTYDITDQLRDGAQTLDIMLGNGWYRGRFGFEPGVKTLYGEEGAILAEVHLQYADGSTQIIGSDESWTLHESGILESSIYDGEVIDQRLLEAADEVKGHAVHFNHPYHLVTARRSPAIVKHEALTPTVLHTNRGDTILDFGQNLTGWVEWTGALDAGKSLKLAYGEVMQEGELSRENLRDAKAQFTYTSDGVHRTVRPHFTFYGFQYVKVEGLDAVDPAQFVAYAIHSDLDEIGHIETGHAKVNQLISNARWSQKDNFLDVPTDCPQRDERMGWTGDAQVFAPTASFNMDTRAFYHKYLHDMKLEQQTLGGSVPHVVPNALMQVHLQIGDAWDGEHGSAAWADAAAIIPWTLYVFYGDETALSAHYPNMKMWADYQWQKDKQNGDLGLITTGFHFADWLALDNPDHSTFGKTDQHYVASSYYYRIMLLTAKAAAVLGKDAEASRYFTQAERIREAIRDKYFDRNGRCTEETQTACVLAIHFELAPEGKEDVVRDQLKEYLDENDGKLTTGFVGTAYLCLALSRMGLTEYAYNLLLNEDYPGWLYEVNMGATTIWERWNSILPDGLLSDKSMNSLNHYAYGAVVEWIYRVVGGLNPVGDLPGFKHALIQPHPDKRLGHAKVTYQSAYGTYVSAWRYTDEAIEYEVQIPKGCTATFRVTPQGGAAITETLSGGTYTFRTPVDEGATD